MNTEQMTIASDVQSSVLSDCERSHWRSALDVSRNVGRPNTPYEIIPAAAHHEEALRSSSVVPKLHSNFQQFARFSGSVRFLPREVVRQT